MQPYASTKKLLLGNLPDAVPALTVQNMFDGVGPVLSVSLLAHGFAFVEMKSDDADRALSQLKGFRLNGTEIGRAHV